MEDNIELELAKDFIELSIALHPEKKFVLPDYKVDSRHQKYLYKAISNMKKQGIIHVCRSAAGAMIITKKNGEKL